MTTQLTRERKPPILATRLVHVHAKPVATRHQPRYADMEPTIRGIEVALLTEFACMSRILRRSSRGKRLEEIHDSLEAALQEIQDLILGGGIRPWRYLRLSRNDVEPEPCMDPIRVGVYPLTGNPMHWGDVLSGLTVMAKANLDKVVYMISDDGERKSDLIPAEIRNAAARDILSLFDPLLLCWNMAHEGRFDPVKDISLLHSLNPGRKLEVHYMVCSGHRLAGQEVSPKRIREALYGTRDPDALAALPYSVFRHMAGGGVNLKYIKENAQRKSSIEKGSI
jgi:hypothetical protein